MQDTRCKIQDAKIKKSPSCIVHHASLSSDGFTLLELIIVIFLITLIIGISTVFFVNTLPSAKFNAAVREMSATIRHAKSLAMLNNEGRSVIIDLDAKTYGINGRSTRGLPANVSIKVNDPLSGEVRTGSYDIVFHPGGGVEGGNIVLWDNKRSANIEIDPVVGAVAIK